MLPAPGQGALAVECRADDADLTGMLALVDDPASRAAVTAERTVLAQLQAGCSAPLGAHGAGTGVMHLRAIVVAEDGGLAVRASQSGPPSRAAELGRDVAAELLRLGAGTIVAGPAVTGNGDDA
jgi:hydroxymethylbilane synthase